MYKIFPCDSNKQPLIKDWPNQATSDDNQINLWKEYFKDKIGYWGIKTGKDSGIYVLDVDVKNGINGFESLKSFPIPATRNQTTRSGGKHYLFRYPDDPTYKYGNTTKFLPGLDTRGEGGYIIYYGTDDAPIADMPEWLKEKVRKKDVVISGDPIKVAPTIAAEILHSSLETIRNAVEGERNNTLNTEAFKIGQLVASGSITKDYAEKVLTDAAMENNIPGYKRTIESGLSGGDRKPMVGPFTEPPAPAFTLPPPPAAPDRWTPKQLAVEDLFNTQYLKRPQLFEDWSTEDIHITVADGGTGKSTLKLYEAICLALGEDFLGFKNVQQGKTLYITGEDSEKKLAAMIGMILKQMGKANDIGVTKKIVESISIKKDDNLCLITKDSQQFLSPNIGAMNRILEAVHDIKPKMIVIDPIASFWGSESMVNDMGKAVSKFVAQLVHESNACVEMINHAGKVSSSTKDMTQFAGRGGTGLVSHARVARVLRTLDNKEYQEMVNKNLEDYETAILCNVNKFSDGSPLLNKPFIIVRDRYGFTKREFELGKAHEDRTEADTQRVFMFIKESRQLNKYPTKNVVIAHFMAQQDKLSESRTKRALDIIQFNGVDGQMIKPINNPDLTSKEKVYTITDMDGNEL